jgi:putative ABC transport system substrate-binding protein
MLLSRHTKRRELITLLGGAAAAWPLAARAQQPAKIPRIGIIDDSLPSRVALGYLEDQNIAFDYAYGDGVPERLAEAAAALRRNREKPAVSLGHRSRSSDEASVRGLHQGQQSIRTA